MSEPQKYPTTTAHFKNFQDEVGHWLHLLGLTGWRVEFAHEPIEARAECRFNLSGRVAVLVLATEFENLEPTEQNVRRSAFHEVWELAFARVWDTANRSDLTPGQRQDLMEEAQHELIRILENTMWDEDWGNRYEVAP